MSDTLTSVIGQVAADLPDATFAALVDRVRQGVSDAEIKALVPTDSYRVLSRGLLRARDAAGLNGEALALALSCAREREDDFAKRRLSVVWTGPTSDKIATRRTDQALLEVIVKARERVIVVSFAVYKVDLVARALVDAAKRGVEVGVVLESAIESRGKIRFEGSSMLGKAVTDSATLYSWPAEKRPTLKNGELASLHAKCAVSDGNRLLVSSANLTDYALTANMELGLLVEGGEVPARVQEHFEALIVEGVLRKL